MESLEIIAAIIFVIGLSALSIWIDRKKSDLALKKWKSDQAKAFLKKCDDMERAAQWQSGYDIAKFICSVLNRPHKQSDIPAEVTGTILSGYMEGVIAHSKVKP